MKNFVKHIQLNYYIFFYSKHSRIMCKKLKQYYNFIKFSKNILTKQNFTVSFLIKRYRVVRILGKVIHKNRIVRDYIYEVDGDFVIHDFYNYIEEICHNLDLPVPIVLTTHIKNFLLFNSTFFTQEDFVEKFFEDKFVVEIIKE